MSCCTLPLADTGRLFSRLAPLHRLRFKLAGFEKTQRQLIEGIQAAGLAGAELLEIGAGAGEPPPRAPERRGSKSHWR